MPLIARLLRTYSLPELHLHPWRYLAAVLAITLGVALAFSVHVINASALNEFSSALRTVQGEPDVQLKTSAAQGFDEKLYVQVASHPAVELASPVIEVDTYTLVGDAKKSIKLLGIDALVAGGISPRLFPIPDEGADRFAFLSPGQVFLNATAAQRAQSKQLKIVIGGESLRTQSLQVAGRVNTTGAPLAVMDIAALQAMMGMQGRISRIDVKLTDTARADPRAALSSLPLPAGVTLQNPLDASERTSNLSRAYRVNMTVLALVALFTGAFLVFSVLSLAVAKRGQQLALLGVLGLTPRERLQLVMSEAAALGVVGAITGIALGTALAALGLRLLGGDLGGGYFSGASPPLQWSTAAAIIYALLGLAAALVGAWWPARAAQALPLAQTLKGLGAGLQSRGRWWIALILIALGAILMRANPVFGIPIAAYVSIGLLLVGGIGLLPVLVKLLYDRLAPWVAHRALPLLAVERARRQRDTAAVAVSGVVAALALAVALTVMVASFRGSVMRWLDAVLPAPLYLRLATGTSSAQLISFPPELVQAVQQTSGVERVIGLRTVPMQLNPSQPHVMLIARPLSDPQRDLPIVENSLREPSPAARAAGARPLYVSEAMVDLYEAIPGEIFEQKLPLALIGSAQIAIDSVAKSSPTSLYAAEKSIETPAYYVAGVWRDYARQFGAVAIDTDIYRRLTGDERVNDLAIWPASGSDAKAVQAAVRQTLAAQASPEIAPLIEFASSDEIRAISLRIFDSSFAVTYWLQAVAIAIGLFGVAASFSAQVLARRKEFGLLAHLGLTREQILKVVAGEGAAWTLIGSLAGALLGLVVSWVLVHVVNPQSFHWTMDLDVPWPRIALLCVAVIAAGTLTAWVAGRAAASKDAVLAVKEDW
jgi:putative ABC transport system permease protein